MTSSPDKHLKGIDVSDYQTKVDYKRVADAGYTFVFVKATEGTWWTGKLFRKHWAGFGAESVGMLRGAYHFFRPLEDAKKQIDRFVKTVQATGSEPELPYALDLEDHKGSVGIQPAVIVDGALAAIDRLEQLTGSVPILYTGPSFFTRMLRGYGALGLKPAPRAMELTRFPLWMADYNPPAADLPWPRACGTGHGWSFWQQSGSATVPGVKGACDVNVFALASEEALCNMKGPRPT